MERKIKSFNEFINEGLISDYKKEREQENKEISTSDKDFVRKLLTELYDIDVPFLFTCKNLSIVSDTVDKDKIRDLDLNRKIVTIKELEKFQTADIKMTEKSKLTLVSTEGKTIDWLKKGEKYKKIWSNIYKWFDKKMEKDEKSFDGGLFVGYLLGIKNDISKELL